MKRRVSSRSFPARRNSSPAVWRSWCMGKSVAPAVCRQGWNQRCIVECTIGRSRCSRTMPRSFGFVRVPDPDRVEQVLVRLRVAFEREACQVGQKIFVHDRNVGDFAALALNPDLAPLEVDVPPAQEPQLVLAKRKTGHERQTDPVAQERLGGDDALYLRGRVRMPFRAPPARAVDAIHRVCLDSVHACRPPEEGGEDRQHLPPRAGS